jgi:FAD/FMN-containing dehydrogenase
MMHSRENRTRLVEPGGIDHHVADLSATIAADVSLQAVQLKLAEAGQWLPIDGDPARSVGELVDTNSTGPLRLGYGAWRDLLLGAQFENGSGELITAGGRSVKNVAGYDLTKLMIGQYGVFGKLVTITTRTYKRPAKALMAQFDPDLARLNAMMISACRPHWAMIDESVLTCGYVGDERTIGFFDTAHRKFAPTSSRCWGIDEDIAHRQKTWRSGDAGYSFRASVPPSRIEGFAKLAQRRDWIADAAFGIVIGECSSGDTSALQRAAVASGGSVILLDERRRPMNYSPDPVLRGILQKLKQAFDPNGSLQPLPVGPS